MKFSRYAAAEWANLDDRSKWEQLAEDDKQAYAEEKEEQRASEVRFASWL